MKRIRFLVIALVIITSMISVNLSPLHASAVEPDESGFYHPTIYINGEKQSLVGVLMPSGSTLVPFRALFDILNIEATFDNETKTLTAVSDNITLKLTSGKMFGTINDKEISLIQSPILGGDNIFTVNLRFIAEAYGADVRYDKATVSIYINYTKKKKKN